MDINFEEPQKKSNEEIEKKEMAKEAAIEVSRKDDTRRAVEEALAEFHENSLNTASKVIENFDATAEDKKRAEDALKENNEAAKQAAQKAESAVSGMKMNEDGTWENIPEENNEAAKQAAQKAESGVSGMKMNEDGTWEDVPETADGTGKEAAESQIRKERAGEKIKLPDDAVRVEGLRQKLDDYKARVKEIRESQNSQFFSLEYRLDSQFKFDILNQLLGTGEADFSRMRDGMDEEFDQEFCNAWDVIRDYAETGGENVVKFGQKSPLPDFSAGKESSAPEKESDTVASSQENPVGAENPKTENEKILWDQMNQKQREAAVCQAALGALNNIAADQKPSLWERMKAGWSSLKESAKEKWDSAKAKLFGEEFAGAREKAKNTWGFLKERLKGVATFGIWEFHQAEKFRAATRDIGKDVNAQARLIEEEEGLSKEEALKEAEAMRAAFEGVNRDPSAEEYEMMSHSISAEKITYNERIVEKIIEDATKSLEERLEKRSLLQGYRSADVGKKVLTPENIALLQERMRHQLNGMRNGQVRGDFKQYAQLMRRNLDPGWWRRYIYGGVEVALDGLALHLVTAPGAAEAVPGHVLTTGPSLPPPPAELVDPMHRTIWQTTAEFLKAHGIAHPTNAQIMEGSKLVAQANHIGVNVWNVPGNPLDVHMQADYLLKMKPLVDNLAHIAAM